MVSDEKRRGTKKRCFLKIIWTNITVMHHNQIGFIVVYYYIR
jgi:hypothetical protein